MSKVLCALAAITLPASANAAAFINGSFETGPAAGTFTTLGAGSSAINGWVVGGGGIDYVGSYWAAQNGSRSIDLSGNAAGSISQTFDTIAGTLYSVTFFLGGNGDGGLMPKVASVSATGGATQMFTAASSAPPNMNYTPFTYNFIALTGSTTLTFASLSGSAYGAVLDNVSVNAAAVPEPAAWALMMLGFGAVGYAMRSRRHKRTARIRFA